ncbi:MAG: HD domain-containing protein [Limnochordaceae bacterium]|nr:HD domain-containing protein [Limnochordaceae bacterium]
MEAWASQRVDKIFKDPVHDSIPVVWRLIQDLIDTPEFQRLRRIRQLGTAAGVYHGAEQSRFGHCLGAMHIMNRVVSHLRETGTGIPDDVACEAAAAALLHDLGHGPFSHALESVLTPFTDHEAWTARILTSPDTMVHQVLAAADPALPQRLVEVLRGQVTARWNEYPYLVSLVASQVDVDRMDYLLRDSLYTGTLYGAFDLDRVIHTLTVRGDQIVFMEKGVPSAEEYVLARHYMYWQVYFHKTTRGEELLLRAVWRRAYELAQAGQLPLAQTPASLHVFFQGKPMLSDFLRLDDTDIVMALKLWRHSDGDPVLADLSRRLLDRDLLKPVFKGHRSYMPMDRLPAAMEIVQQAGFDSRYYCLPDTAADVAYDYYTEEERGGGKGKPQAILVVDERDHLRELSKLSEVIRALVSRQRTAVNLFVPARCRQQVQQLFEEG